MRCYKNGKALKMYASSSKRVGSAGMQTTAKQDLVCESVGCDERIVFEAAGVCVCVLYECGWRLSTRPWVLSCSGVSLQNRHAAAGCAANCLTISTNKCVLVCYTAKTTAATHTGAGRCAAQRLLLPSTATCALAASQWCVATSHACNAATHCRCLP